MAVLGLRAMLAQRVTTELARQTVPPARLVIQETYRPLALISQCPEAQAAMAAMLALATMVWLVEQATPEVQATPVIRAPMVTEALVETLVQQGPRGA